MRLVGVTRCAGVFPEVVTKPEILEVFGLNFHATVMAHQALLPHGMFQPERVDDIRFSWFTKFKSQK